MKALFLLITLFMVACGSPVESQTQAKEVEIDSRLSLVVNQFLDDCTKFDVKAKCDSRLSQMDSIAIVDIDLTAEASCIRSGNVGEANSSPISIIVTHSFLDKNETYQKFIIYHELGHCLLNEPHSGNDQGKNPIMQPYVSDVSALVGMQDDNIISLFNSAK